MTDDAERALLAERILAEQEERRRLGELLHDGPVQHLSAIAQIVDAALAASRSGERERTEEILSRGLELARGAARELRALCEDLEPKALSEVGFAAAVEALARRFALAARRRDRPRRRARRRARRACADRALPDPPRGDRPGRPPGRSQRIDVSIRETPGGGAELVVSDDGPPERRSAVLEALAERAATLNARFSSEVRYPRGSTIRVELPPSAARR